MKIEDFSSNRAISPLQKLNVRSTSTANEVAWQDLDLSFLELLNDLQVVVGANLEAALPESPTQPSDAEQLKKSERPKEKAVEKVVSLQERLTQREALPEGVVVSPEDTLLKEELSVLDVQYLKQEIIPALPILMGTVPFNQVFTSQADGEVSYEGLALSPKLTELIQKGYKTGSPIRIELDAHSALVLKIRNGQVSAEFVSLNPNALMVTQQELDQLRNRMLAQNLPVGLLESKSQQRQSRPQQDHRHPEDQDSD